MLLLVVIVFSIPAVQTIVAKKVTKNINETYGTTIQIDRLGLNWKGEVDIRGVYIEDHHGDTLIFSEEIQTNILSIKKLADGKPDFGFIDLTNAKLYVKTYKGEEDDNLFIFTEKFDDGTPPSGNIFTLLSENVTLLNTHLKISDENSENPEIINFTHLNLEGEKFKIIGPDVQARIKSLTFDALQGYSIQNLQADFSYTLDAISFKDLLLETADSYIKGDVILNYGEEGLSDFKNNVVFDANLEESKISTNDLNTFYDEFGRNIASTWKELLMEL